jgi:hypothetical protein
MDLALVFQDQVDDLASSTWAKQPPPHSPVRVALVLRLTTPRCELQHAQHLGIAVKRLIRQCGDLLQGLTVGDYVIHLPAQPLADQGLDLLT